MSTTKGGYALPLEAARPVPSLSR